MRFAIDTVRPPSLVTGLRKVSILDPLETERHIRLLKLYPPGWPAQVRGDEETKKVRCDVYQISQASLKRLGADHLPCYSALSYTWGNGRPCRIVQCGDQSIMVNLNLYLALVWVRLPTEPILLWVDQLCIRQQDAAEKSAQVRQMHQIFEQAHVIHWLGAQGGFKDLQKVLGDAQILYSLFPGNLVPSLDDMLERWRATGRTSEDFYGLSWAGMQRVLARPYFRRLWVVQEIILGKSHVCRIGRYSFDLRLLERLYSLMLNRRLGGGDWSWVDSGSCLLDARMHREGAYVQGVDPLEMAKSYCDNACTDDRDRIYGLSPLFSTPFNVDYRLSVQQVFINFAVYCIRTTGKLSVLSADLRRTYWRPKTQLEFATTDIRQWTTGLPSWCPDWAGPLHGLRELDLQCFQAGGRRSAVLAHVTASTLSLQGVIVSRIQKCSLTLGESTESDFLGHLRAIKSAEAVALDLLQSVPISKLWKAYLDVLVAGSELGDVDSLSPWSEHLPVRDLQSVLFKKLGGTWMAKCSKAMYHAAGLAIPPSLRHEQRAVAKEMFRVIHDASSGTRMFSTSNGHLGTGPEGLYVGDVVCVLYGGDVPYVLRKVGDQGQYKLIGEAYVHGIMQGEAIEAGLQQQDFLLI